MKVEKVYSTNCMELLDVFGTTALIMLMLLIVHFLLMKRNFRQNSSWEKDGIFAGIINNQNSEEIEGFSFGTVTARRAGCEAIAIHNACLLLKNEMSLSRTILSIQKSFGMLLFGVLGTSPFAIGRILRRENVQFEKVKHCYFEKDGVYIISFWNGRKVFQGLHTVCFLKKGESYKTFNLAGKGNISLVPPEVYAKRFICGYFLGPEKTEAK